MKNWLELIDTPGDYFVVALLVFVVVIIFNLIPDAQCPKCRRNQAMEKTGKRNKDSDYVLSSTNIEWKCKHCGHVKWEKRSASTEGGD